MRNRKASAGAAKSSVPTDRGEYSVGNERTAHARISGDTVEILNVRNTDYSGEEREVRWMDQTFDLSELTNLWVVFSFFGNMGFMAHAELAFEFADSRNVVASFEVRPLKGQRYSIVGGMGKSFELVARWATERDAFMRRATREADTRMHMLEADITHSRIVEIFHEMARRTNELHVEPEWYHTFTNSCTTNMVNLVHEVRPGELSKTIRVLGPGWLPKLWAKQGIVKMNGTFDETMAAAAITERCLEIGHVDDFSAQLHGRV